MGISYQKYLDEGTKCIMNLFSSYEMDQEEREAIVSAFSEALQDCIGNTDKLQDSKFLIYSVSIRYVDEKISEILSDTKASTSDYNKALQLCTRERDMLNIFSSKKWKFPQLSNSAVDQCERELNRRKESIIVISRILKEDTTIEQQIHAAQEQLSVKSCDNALEILSKLEKDITLCKQRRFSVPAIKNMNIRDTEKSVRNIRKIAVQKEDLYEKIYESDLKLSNILSLSKVSPDRWNDIIDLCQSSSALLSECRKKQWPLPLVRYPDPDKLADQYRHYQTMSELDRIISSEREILSSSKQYAIFYSNCSKQNNNIDTCRQNEWPVPDLQITDPENLVQEVKKEKIKKDRARKIKRRIRFSCVIVIATVAAIFVGIYEYRKGKVQIPFDPSYAQGRSLDTICEELKEAGFVSVDTKSTTSGWEADNTVIDVSIDSDESYKKGTYEEPDVNVTVIYSSPQRVHVTDLFKDWNKQKSESLAQKLKDAGFTKVNTKNTDTKKRDEVGLTAGITLDGEIYTDEDCYLAKSIPITISSYVYKQVAVGEDSKTIRENKKNQYSKVIDNLKESGFTNITVYRNNDLLTGWKTKEGSIASISVAGNSDFSAKDTFDYDAPIVIIVNTFKDKGCDDITEIAP